MPAATHHCSRGTEAIAGCASHELLDYAVLEGMITDDCQSSLGAEKVNSLFESRFQIL